MADPSQEYGTIIGADAKLKGDLTFESAAKVVGQVEGSITGKGKIHIASGAKCKAEVHAKEIAVEGLIEGNVQATDRVDLQPKGRITGDVVAARMSMADGAAIVGHCRIGVNGEVASGKPGATAEVKTTSQPAAPISSKK